MKTTHSSDLVRLAIASDTHGNLPALEAAIADARTLAPDLIAHAGDMVNGPASGEVMGRILAEGWQGVLGNHEDYVLRFDDPAAPALWRSERFAPAHWARKNLAPHHLTAIAAWPITYRPHPEVTLVHGTTASLRHALRSAMSDEKVKAMYRDLQTPLVVCGHTHLPLIRRIDGRLYVNVGSTGLTLDGDPRAAYAVLTRRGGLWDAEIRRVAYDRSRVLHYARKDGWLEEGGGVAAAMVHEMLNGRSLTTPFLRWWEATCPDRGSVEAYRAFVRSQNIEPLV